MNSPVIAPSSEILRWPDTDGAPWQIDLRDDVIVLDGPAGSIELPKARWPRDILITPHHDGLIVRFETFERSATFVVPGNEAARFLAHFRPHSTEPTAANRGTPDDSGDRPLLWPKVSPWAVWALICSSLCFLPVVGVLPALATVILVVCHRKRVRRSDAYRHSRILATVATVFMMCGLVVCALGTWGFVRNLGDSSLPITPHMQRATEETRRLITPAQEPKSKSAHALAQQANSFLEEKHNWALIVAGFFVVLLSLTVHEAAHAISAWWLGDDFAKRLGRVTLNPVAHIDPFGTVLLPLLLLLSGSSRLFGWARPVPVRLDYVDRPRRAHMLIALAGPGSNLLLAAASLMLLIGISCTVSLLAPNAVVEHLVDPASDAVVSASGFALAPLFGPLCTILKLSFLANVLLAFFNLIPIPPLDGSWVLEHLFPRTFGPIFAYLRPFAFLLIVGLIYFNVLAYLMVPGLIVLHVGFDMLALCTGL